MLRVRAVGITNSPSSGYAISVTGVLKYDTPDPLWAQSPVWDGTPLPSDLPNLKNKFGDSSLPKRRRHNSPKADLSKIFAVVLLSTFSTESAKRRWMFRYALRRQALWFGTSQL